MATEVALKMDSRGRVTIGRHVKANGIEPAPWWRLRFGPNQSLELTPLTLTTEPEGSTA